MRLPEFQYLRPKTLRKAVKTLASDPEGSVLLAGGTDLIVNMKHRVIQPGQLINLKSIPKLAYISSKEDGLHVGTLTTLEDLISSTVVAERYPVLKQAAQEVGAYAHQSMGTIGGNLCQGTRCRFYNQSSFWRGTRALCYKAGGKICHVVRKPGECHSTYCGDMAPAFMVLGARIRIAGPDGERVLPLSKLYSGDGKKPLSLKTGEILKEVAVPPPFGSSLYLKWRMRESIEYPVIALAVHLDCRQGGKIKQARIVFSGVGSGPVEAFKAEKMLKTKVPDNRTIEDVSKWVGKEISPMRTSIASPAYKRRMAGILLKQALEEIMN